MWEGTYRKCLNNFTLNSNNTTSTHVLCAHFGLAKEYLNIIFAKSSLSASCFLFWPIWPAAFRTNKRIWQTVCRCYNNKTPASSSSPPFMGLKNGKTRGGGVYCAERTHTRWVHTVVARKQSCSFFCEKYFKFLSFRK